MKRLSWHGCLMLILVATGCASAQLTSEGSRVRIVNNSPHSGECKYLGSAQGSYSGDSVSGGIVAPSDSYAFAIIDLKNNAADMGANTVDLMGFDGKYASGEAYRCN